MTRSIHRDAVANDSVRAHPAVTRLNGRYVRIELLDRETHAEELFISSHLENKARVVWDYLPHGPFGSIAEFQAWLEGFAEDDGRVFYAVVDEISRKALGMASFSNIRVESGVLELGYIWFAPPMQQTRGATEAVYLLLRHAFEGLQYRRVEWLSDASNERCTRAAERFGFVREGTLYQHMIVKGRNRDAAAYALLDNEWAAQAKRFAAWLAPENFDASGQQVCTLNR
jgi:RimJ/RimL family protein N-acetyltransferase